MPIAKSLTCKNTPRPSGEALAAKGAFADALRHCQQEISSAYQAGNTPDIPGTAWDKGLSWSASIQQDRVKVSLFHNEGWEITSTTKLDANSELDKAAADAREMLRWLLGLSLDTFTSSQSCGCEATQATPPAVAEAITSDATAEESIDDVELLLEGEDQKTCVQLIKALPVDTRKVFAASFRKQFDLDASVKVPDAITHRKHKVFIESFVNEYEQSVLAPVSHG